MKSQNSKNTQIILFLTVFLYLLGFGILIPLIPHLGRDLNATSTQAGMLMATYSIMQFLFSPVWGKLSDRWGRRRILLISLSLESIAYIGFAWARSLEFLFIMRGLTGFFGASLSTANAAMADVTDEKDRSRGMALIGAAFGLGFVLGPAIGGGLAVVADSISQAPFFKTTFVSSFVSVMFFITFVFAYFKLPETLPQHKRQSSGIDRLSFLKNNLQKPVLRELILSFFLLSFAMSSMEATLVYFMADRFDWNLKNTSFGFAYIGVVLVITQGFLVRKLLPKIGEKRILIWSLPVFTLGMAIIPWSDSLFWMAVSMTLISLGIGHSNPSLNGSISLLVSQHEQGSTMGMTQSLSSLGRILGPVIGGFLYSFNVGYPFLLSAVLGVLAWGLLFFRYPQLPSQALR